MVHKNLVSEGLSVNDELIQALIPRMALDHLDWDEVKDISELKNSEVLKCFKTHIRNLKKEPESLDEQVRRIREAQNPRVEPHDASNQQQRHESQDQTPASRSENQGLPVQEQVQANVSFFQPETQIIKSEDLQAPKDKEVHFQLDPEKYSLHQLNLIKTTLELDDLYHKIKTSKREQ